MITLKINMVTTEEMKLKMKMSMQILATIKKCLTLVIIQLIQNIKTIQRD